MKIETEPAYQQIIGQWLFHGGVDGARLLFPRRVENPTISKGILALNERGEKSSMQTHAALSEPSAITARVSAKRRHGSSRK